MNHVDINTLVSASKKLQAEDAKKLLREKERLYVAKGKRIRRFNLQEDVATPEELVEFLLGPTGNLRAPTIQVGRTLLVGFNQEIYEEVFR